MCSYARHAKSDNSKFQMGCDELTYIRDAGVC